ncbi:MAG: hypothetical protein PVF82_16495, partial [Gammaproteobacteria bacterium]
ISAFPAWHLLNKPGLANTLTIQDVAPENEHYQIVQRLLQAKQEPDTEHEIKIRQQLQKLDPVFFEHFIKLMS